MNLRAVFLHGGILAALLVVALVTREVDGEPTSRAPTGTVLIPAAEGELEAVWFERHGRSVHLVAERDERGRWFSGTATHPPRAAGGEPAAAPESTVFRAGLAVVSLWVALEPLRVSRVLTDVADDKLEEFGLAEPTGRLVLTIRGEEHAFDIGSNAFGSPDVYARDAQGRVVVLPSRAMEHLTGPAVRLRETRILETNRDGMSGLVFERGPAEGRQRLEIRQVEGDAPGRSFWAEAGATTGDERYREVVDALLNLSAMEYTGDRALPREWQEVFTVTVLREGRPAERMTLHRLPPATGSWDPTVAEAPPASEFRVTSDHLRMVARVSGDPAGALMDHLLTVMGPID